MGKFTISGYFSIAMLNYQRVYPKKMEMKIEIKHEEPTELGQGAAFGTTYAVRIHCREFTPLSGKTPNMGMAAFI